MMPPNKLPRITDISENELLTHTFTQFFGDQNNIGFICNYIPQFSTTDSEPTYIAHNTGLLSTKLLSALHAHLDRIILAPDVKKTVFAPAIASTINIDGYPLRFENDIVIGHFFIFAQNGYEISRELVDSYLAYCEDSISLRKKATALHYIGNLCRDLPGIDDSKFFGIVGENVANALKCAEVLILKRSATDIRKFTTVYSFNGGHIDVPEGPSLVEYLVSTKQIVVENDVSNSSAREYKIHNHLFFDNNNYRSFLACSLINENPDQIFVLACFFRRANAISHVEKELFETLCMTLEGMCRRDNSLEYGKNLNNKKEQERLVKHCLLIADVMHDATEDLIVVRQNLSNLNLKSTKDIEKLDRTKIILEEIIESGKGFKQNVTKNGKNSQFTNMDKYNVRAVVKEVLDKYSRSDGNKNIYFYNEVPSDLEVKLIKYSFKRGIDNALKNSIQHLRDISHRRREIRISIIRAPNKIIVEVWDNGMGISDTIRPKVTELSFSTTGGMGHGMSIIEAAALAHEGEIFIDSELNRYCSIRISINIHA